MNSEFVLKKFSGVIKTKKGRVVEMAVVGGGVFRAVVVVGVYSCGGCVGIDVIVVGVYRCGATTVGVATVAVGGGIYGGGATGVSCCSWGWCRRRCYCCCWR